MSNDNKIEFHSLITQLYRRASRAVVSQLNFRNELINRLYEAVSRIRLGADSAIDVAMMVRVIHHVEKVPAFLGEMGRVLAGGGTYVLEFASKRHLKSILRYALRGQSWNPFDQEPVEFVAMNFDFHPDWMRDCLREAMFHVKHIRTVSHFRLPLLKKAVPANLLATADGLCQPTGAWWQLTPSVFVQCTSGKEASATPTAQLFRCPSCHSSDLAESAKALVCHGCSTHWPIEDGIYTFKVGS